MKHKKKKKEAPFRITFLSCQELVKARLELRRLKTTVNNPQIRLRQLSPIANEEQAINPSEEAPAQKARAFLGASPASSIDKPGPLAPALERKDHELNKQRRKAQGGNGVEPIIIEKPVRAHHSGAQQGRDGEVKTDDIRRAD